MLTGDEPAVAPQHQEGHQGRRRGRSTARRGRTSRPSTSSTSTRPRATTSRPRPLSYFETMFEALGAEEPDRIRLYLARHEGDLVAGTIWIRVGAHTWYSYGASSTEKRDVRGSNAVQWQMIRDSLAVGAHVYDLRGITDTLDADDSPRRADPVQGRHRRRGSGVRRRVGPAAEPRDLQGLRPLHEAAGVSDSWPDLYVDGDRWRTHLKRRPRRATPGSSRSPRATATASAWTASRARPSGSASTPSPSGTYDELPERRPRGTTGRCWCSRPGARSTRRPTARPERVIHTVGRLEDLEALAEQGRATGHRPRVVLERMTSMLRHGFTATRPAGGRPAIAGEQRGVDVEGVALHLPLAKISHLSEVERLMNDVVAAGLGELRPGSRTVWVSHLTDAELDTLGATLPRLHLPPAHRHRAVARRPWRPVGAGDGARRPPGRARRHLRLPRPYGSARRHDPGGLGRNRARHRPRGTDGRGHPQGPGRLDRARWSRRGRVRAVAVHRGRQAAPVRRATAHAGLDAVHPGRCPRCPRSATRSTVGCGSPRPPSTRSTSADGRPLASAGGRVHAATGSCSGRRTSRTTTATR